MRLPSPLKSRLTSLVPRPPQPPWWLQLCGVALGRRLFVRRAHAVEAQAIRDGRGVLEVRWLPARQLYSLWLQIDGIVYADLKPRLRDFAAGVQDLLIEVEGPKGP